MIAALRRRVLEIVRAQQRELLALAPAHRRAVVAAAASVQRDLLLRMQAMNPASFTAQQTRMRLVELGAIVDSVGRDYGAGVGSAIEEAGTVAAALGRESLIAQLEAWAPRFRDSIRRTGTAAMAGGVLDDGLLEYYQASRATYGLEAIQKMRAAMSRSALAGETLSESWVKMSQAIVMPEWRAERIVRTEQSFAANRAQLSQAGAMYGEGANASLRKQLIATFDGRTGDDSRFVHEQVRKLDEDFEDDRGRRYAHPPNRPNDREVMVVIPAPSGDFERILAEVESLEPDDRRALVERELAEARERMQRREASATRRGVMDSSGNAVNTSFPNATAMAGRIPFAPTSISAATPEGVVERVGAVWASSLEPDELEAVEAWNNGRHTEIKAAWNNSAAKGLGARLLLPWLTAISKAPRWRGRSFRGLSRSQLFSDGRRVHPVIGEEFRISPMTSWSRNEATAMFFAGRGHGIVLELVESESGLAMISAALRSNQGHEEVILLQGGRFRILHVDTMGRIQYIRIEEILP